MRTACLAMLMIGLGCASKGAPEPTVDEFLEDREAAEIAPVSTESPAAQQPLTVLPDPSDDAWTSTHYNLTVQVQDPSTAVDHARSILDKGGATIQNANRQGQNGSINATTDRTTYAKVAAALRDLKGVVISESASQNDLGPQIRQLRERLDLAREADDRLANMAKVADAAELEPVMYLLELNHRERQNLESQIRNYWDQAGKTYVYLNFQKPPT